MAKGSRKTTNASTSTPTAATTCRTSRSLATSSSEELKDGDSAFLRGRFEEAHRQRYNFDLPDSPLEIATVRVVGRGTIKGVSLLESEDGAGQDASGAITRNEQVYFDGEWMETPIYDRAKLSPGNTVAGPAVVVQDDTTTVIEPGYAGAVDRFGNILIEEA